jgi:hypothetical protein
MSEREAGNVPLGDVLAIVLASGVLMVVVVAAQL